MFITDFFSFSISPAVLHLVCKKFWREFVYDSIFFFRLSDLRKPPRGCKWQGLCTYSSVQDTSKRFTNHHRSDQGTDKRQIKKVIYGRYIFFYLNLHKQKSDIDSKVCATEYLNSKKICFTNPNYSLTNHNLHRRRRKNNGRLTKTA